jgi:polar amino acid transport system substrate-binding protein
MSTHWIRASAFSIVMALTSTAMAQVSTVAGPDTPVTCPEAAKDLPLAKAGTLTMSVNATTPPSQFIDKAGHIVGMNVDFGNEIARRLCLKPDYVNVQFEVQIPGLQNKRWDMINTGLYFTPERAKIMQLVPYSVNSLALIAPAGNPKGIAQPKDLAGRVVGVEIAGFEEKKLHAIDDEQVKAGLKPMDIRVFNTYGETFQALRAGQLDAVFASDRIGAYYQKQGQFTIAVTGLFPGSPAAFATTEPRIASAVVMALTAMAADGTYQKLMDYYGSATIDKWSDYPGKFQAYYTP